MLTKNPLSETNVEFGFFVSSFLGQLFCFRISPCWSQHRIGPCKFIPIGDSRYNALNRNYHICHQFFKIFRHPVRRLLNFGVVKLCITDACCHIRNAGDSAHFHFHMSGCHGFACSTHTDCVCAPASDHSDFCRCLVIRPGQLYVYPFLKWYSAVFCTFTDDFLKIFYCIPHSYPGIWFRVLRYSVRSTDLALLL